VAQRPATASVRSGSATKQRILDAAGELFYSQGIRATSADRIIEKVGITKVTFYRHFPTKSDLVVAYLGEQSRAERGWVESLRRDGDPAGSLHQLATGIGEVTCRPGFRGCAFLNAAAELADPDDPVRAAVDTHRAWLLDTFAALAREAGIDDTRAAARQLLILRDGAMVQGYLGEPSAVAAALEAAFSAVMASSPGSTLR